LLKWAAHYRYRAVVLTVGVDLASQPKLTAVCWIKWESLRAEAFRVECSANDDALLAAVSAADKVGIDVPFGWPTDFVAGIAEYTHTGIWPSGIAQPTTAPKYLQFRETDRFVHEKTRRWPLSVSSDRIAIPAMKAAALFSRLAAQGEIVRRDGSGKVVEVYPAAALRVWGFNADRYKRKENHDARCRLLESIAASTEAWLTMSPAIVGSCQSSDDALDALVAALVARAASSDLCEPVPEGKQDQILREGWIALPRAASLPELALN
jgi:predicted nuclease with RNAse H fold